MMAENEYDLNIPWYGDVYTPSTTVPKKAMGEWYDFEADVGAYPYVSPTLESQMSDINRMTPSQARADLGIPEMDRTLYPSEYMPPRVDIGQDPFRPPSTYGAPSAVPAPTLPQDSSKMTIEDYARIFGGQMGEDTGDTTQAGGAGAIPSGGITTFGRQYTYLPTDMPRIGRPTYVPPEWSEEKMRLRVQESLAPHLGQLRRMTREAIQRANSATNPTLRKYILTGALQAYGDALSNAYSAARTQGMGEYETEYSREKEAGMIKHQEAMDEAAREEARRMQEWRYENIRTGAIPGNA